MPWRETSPMEQRLEFVREYADRAVHDDRARARTTGSVARPATSGSSATRRRARAACTIARGGRITVRTRRIPSWSTLLVALRRRHPRWGAKKLLAVGGAAASPHAAWPSRSTVCDAAESARAW